MTFFSFSFLARRPAPRPPPCFRSPGSASPAPRGSRGGREVMQGADYHEKGCAWKSLLHATVSLTKGGWLVVVEEKGLWWSHQKTCSKLDATQARGGGFRLNLEGWALRVRTPTASPGDWKPKSPSSFSSCPPFSPPCPLSIFSCNSVVTAFSAFSCLSIFLLQSRFPPNLPSL